MHRAARSGQWRTIARPAHLVAGCRRCSARQPWTRHLHSSATYSFTTSTRRSLDLTTPPPIPPRDPRSEEQDTKPRHHPSTPDDDHASRQPAESLHPAETTAAAAALRTEQRADSPSQLAAQRDARDKNSSYGSASRRWQRNRRPKELPPIHIPQWFLDRNVMLHDHDSNLTPGVLDVDEAQSGDEALQSNRDPGSSETGGEKQKNTSPFPRSLTVTPSAATGMESRRKGHSIEGGLSQRRYNIHPNLYLELRALIASSFLATQASKSAHFPASRSHLKLHAPLDGASYFLDLALESAAKNLNADLVRFDAQDLAEMGSDYVAEGPDAKDKTLWTLGYDVQQPFIKAREADEDEAQDQANEQEEDGDGDEADGMTPSARASGRGPGRGRRGTASIVIGTSFEEMLGRADGSVLSLPSQISDLINPGGAARAMSNQNGNAASLAGQSSNGAQQWNDMKLTSLLESLIETNQIKRVAVSASGGASSESDPVVKLDDAAEAAPDATPDTSTTPAAKTIIQVKDFKELSATPVGSGILDKILSLVEKKRKDGQRIMIVGTTASRDLMPEMSKSGIDGIQAEDPTSLYRTMVLTPGQTADNSLYRHDEWLRTSDINLRHLRDMVRRLEPAASKESPHAPSSADELGSEHLRNELGERPLFFDQVHRLASTYVGAKSSGLHFGPAFEPQHATESNMLLNALAILQSSDHEKSSWAKRTAKHEQSASSSSEQVSKSKRLVDSLKPGCNNYEQRLLQGVVDPEDIRTTFSDVHVPSDTVDALKDLTSLSLSRPDAFEYGVLATDKITGALLYGPPGTGKTLLAKAVAKESGATVLEVSGSDVYDMFVGEGEKRVRAIFTLAKKLSPCVVFIDEADAIFSSRGNRHRNSHRELINQFLREWDGMTDTNAFVMVATNRPFDLDDAALRRLPRRLLVDLPDERDRSAILSIHLKGERVDAAVDVSQLARDTRLYSGSDLKNLVVAAALAAVRDENEAAATQRGDADKPSYSYPERRVLGQRHFDKALAEITSSVSDDMASLQAIKKFDEKYGDRRARRSKKTYGFAAGEDAPQDTAKVRAW